MNNAIFNTKNLDCVTSNTMPGKGTFPIVKGRGLKFWDTEGNQYMDFASQTLNLLFGQCYPPIVKAVVNQANNLTYVSSRFGSNAYFETVSRLIDLAPEEITRANIKMCDGSDANETAVKIAKKYTGKSGIISFNKAHTGQTTQTILLRGYDRDEKTLNGSSENVFFVSPPACKEKGDYIYTINEIRKVLQNNNQIGCLLIDPIMVNAGVLVNQDTKMYLKEIENLCKEYDLILIFDENQSFGWLPEIFAAKYFEVSPDIITLGKGLSSGHPLAGVIIKEKLDGIIGYNEADFTNGGHPLACAASNATLTLLKEKDFDIIGKQNYIYEKLEKLKKLTSIKINNRGVGLIHAIEVIGNSNVEIASRIYEKALEKGVFLRLYKQNVVIKPPIIVTYEEIDVLFDVLTTVICDIE